MSKQNLSRHGKLLSLALGLSCGLALGAHSAQAATVEEITAALGSNKLGLSKSRAARLNGFYKARNNYPAFNAAQVSVLNKQSLIDLINSQGLETIKYLPQVDAHCPADFAALYAGVSVDCELALSEALVRIGDHLQNGQLDPASVDSENIKMTKKTNSSAAGLNEVLDNRPQDLISFLDQQAPQHFLYQRHKKALNDFMAIKARGGWKPLASSSKKLALGSKGAAVLQVKTILAAHGYPIYNMDDTYDADTEAAVRDLQVATLLPVTGVVSSASATIFNQFFAIELDRRIARLKLDMEKLRWMPSQLEGSFLFVGLGEQQLTWFDGNSFNGIKMKMKTINGRTDRKTPMMRDTVTSVLLNPPWTVPPGVLAKDKLPMFQKQSYWEMQDYFNQNHYTLVDMKNSSQVNPLMVNWQMITAANISFYIRQKPGIHNALGVFKFNLTNPYAIYLHDTNQRNLFGEAQRLLSSGCVRLEKPQELAEEILRGTVWDRTKIDSTIAHYPNEVPNTTTIAVKNKLPVYLMYMTSSVKEDGIVRFHPDYYGMNAKMLERLESTKNDI